MENKSVRLVNEKYVKVSGLSVQPADIVYGIVLYPEPVNAGRSIVVCHKVTAVKPGDVIGRSFAAKQRF